MSFRPIVAVSAAIRREHGVPLARLRTNYLSALENARLIPIVAAPLPDVSAAAELIERVDGLVLTGGADVNPSLYGEEPHAMLGEVSDERDVWEVALVHAARASNLPVLAICRGVQVLNVALGGTLYQDLASQRPGEINHDPDLPRTNRSHVTEIASDSRLGRAVGLTQIRTNSVHHQAIRRAADELRIVANAADGVIEGVESAPDSQWWCVGVQWHPEDLADDEQPWDRSIFEALAAQVMKRR